MDAEDTNEVEKARTVVDWMPNSIMEWVEEHGFTGGPAIKVRGGGCIAWRGLESDLDLQQQVINELTEQQLYLMANNLYVGEEYKRNGPSGVIGIMIALESSAEKLFQLLYHTIDSIENDPDLHDIYKS